MYLVCTKNEGQGKASLISPFFRHVPNQAQTRHNPHSLFSPVDPRGAEASGDLPGSGGQFFDTCRTKGRRLSDLLSTKQPAGAIKKNPMIMPSNRSNCSPPALSFLFFLAGLQSDKLKNHRENENHGNDCNHKPVGGSKRSNRARKTIDIIERPES